MKIFTIQKETCPYVWQLDKIVRGRVWLFEAMKILRLSLRGIAEVCGYKGDEEFKVFIRKFSQNKSLKLASPRFDEIKCRVENELRRLYRDEVDLAELEMVKWKEDCNRDNRSDCK